MINPKKPIQIMKREDLESLSEGDMIATINEGTMRYSETVYGKKLLCRMDSHKIHKILATNIDSSGIVGCTIKEEGLYVEGIIWPNYNGNCKPYNMYDQILTEDEQ